MPWAGHLVSAHSDQRLAPCELAENPAWHLFSILSSFLPVLPDGTKYHLTLPTALYTQGFCFLLHPACNYSPNGQIDGSIIRVIIVRIGQQHQAISCPSICQLCALIEMRGLRKKNISFFIIANYPLHTALYFLHSV